MNQPVLSEALDGDYESRPHVLVVDDDIRICELVSKYLTGHGYVVMSAYDTSEAALLLRSFEFDLLVVDVMMPGQSGVEFTNDLRDRGVNVPVLLLTALGEAQDRIKGLQSGADDYLPKPFEPEELLLRLKAILRRSMVQKKRKDEVRIGPWVFDGGVRLFSEDGEELGLTATEVSLLQALAGKNGDVMSRDDLAEACGLKASERSIDVQVTRLRRKIEDDSKNPRHLLTVRGKGYLLRTN